MEEVAAAQCSGRGGYAEIAHGAAHAVRIVRDTPLDITSRSPANRDRRSVELAYHLRQHDGIPVGIQEDRMDLPRKTVQML